MSPPYRSTVFTVTSIVIFTTILSVGSCFFAYTLPQLFLTTFHFLFFFLKSNMLPITCHFVSHRGHPNPRVQVMLEYPQSRPAVHFLSVISDSGKTERWEPAQPSLNNAGLLRQIESIPNPVCSVYFTTMGADSEQSFPFRTDICLTRGLQYQITLILNLPTHHFRYQASIFPVVNQATGLWPTSGFPAISHPERHFHYTPFPSRRVPLPPQPTYRRILPAPAKQDELLKRRKSSSDDEGLAESNKKGRKDE